MAAASSIRIVLAEVPGLMGGVVRRAIEAERDMTIVDEIAEPVDLADTLSRCECDVVVATLSTNLRVRSPYQRLLFRDVPVAFVALDPDGRRLQAYDRSVHKEFDVDELLTVIRHVAKPRADSESVH